MPLSEQTLDEQAGRLVEHYRPGEPANRFSGWLDELEQAFLKSEVVNDAVFTAAVSKCIAMRADRNLPLVAELRLYVDGEWHAFKREQAKALPAPTLEPTRPDRAAFARNVAIGRLRVRNGRAPTDAEVDAFLAAEQKAAPVRIGGVPVTASTWTDVDESGLLERHPHLKAAKL